MVKSQELQVVLIFSSVTLYMWGFCLPGQKKKIKLGEKDNKTMNSRQIHSYCKYKSLSI